VLGCRFALFSASSIVYSGCFTNNVPSSSIRSNPVVKATRKRTLKQKNASKHWFSFRFIQAIWSGRIPNVTQHLDQERFSKWIWDRKRSDLCSDGLSTTLSTQLNLFSNFSRDISYSLYSTYSLDIQPYHMISTI